MRKITVIKNGKPLILWGLIKQARNKNLRNNFDFDYIDKLMEQLNSDDSQQVAEATEALIFLDAYIHAAFDGNTKHMHAACIKVSKEQTKEFYNARNAAQRDVLNNITPSQLEKIPEAVLANTFTIGDLVADYRKVKRTLKRRGISVNAPVPAAAEATVPPVRQCTLEEIAEAQRRLEKK